MKTIFDKATRNELVNRINTLNENNTAQWGKMTVAQMVRHCALWEETLTGKVKCKRVFIGRLIGPMILKQVLKDDAPMMRKAGTVPELKITTTDIDLDAEKKKWIALLLANDNFADNGFIHPVFGRMTREQVGQLDYKHTDHHLRQFNA